MGRLSRRALVATGAALAAPAIVWAQPREIITGGVVRVGFSAIPEQWDPLNSRDFNTLWLSTLVYDTLLQFGPDGISGPGLATYTGWSMDAMSLTLDLRRSVFFPDGTPLAPADVILSLERARAHSWRLETVESIADPGDGTLVLRTSVPDASLEASLASPEVPILPGGAPDFAEAVAAGRPPRGTGPFKPLPLSGDEIRLLANPRYWQIGRPRIGGVRISGMSEESMRSTALLTGAVDLLPHVPLLDAALVDEQPTLSLLGQDSTIGCVLVLNVEAAPLRDRGLRRLLNRAIDREELVNAATANRATAQQVPVPLDHWAVLEAPLEAPEPEELRQTFRDLGYPIGLRLRMVTDERNVSLSNAAVFLQDQLQFVGIQLTVDPLDADTLAETVAVRDFDILATSLDAWRDPHELFRPWVRSDGARNMGGFAHERCDRLIDAAIQVPEPERRAPLYQEIQDILLQEVPFVVLYLQRYLDGMSDVLNDYPEYPPVSGLGMRHVWMSRATPEP